MKIRLRIAAAGLTATLVVFGPTAIPRAADRPTVAGPNGAVSAGHPLTSTAAFEVLLKGGNAFDAGVAAMLVGGTRGQGPGSPRCRAGYLNQATRSSAISALCIASSTDGAKPPSCCRSPNQELRVTAQP